MTMISFATTIAFVLYSIGFSLAAANTQALVSGLQADGYTQIEAKTGVSEVEAVLGSEKFELVHDGVTGAVLKSEAQAERPGDDTSVGGSFDSRADDFVDGRSRSRGSLGDSADAYDDSDDRADVGGDDRGGDRGGDRGDGRGGVSSDDYA
jgi:hypothetical protein